MFTKAGIIVKKNLKRYNLEKGVQAAYVCSSAEEMSLGKFRPISFRSGILTIAVKNNILAQEIQWQKEKLINSINQKIGDNIVKALKFRVIAKEAILE